MAKGIHGLSTSTNIPKETILEKKKTNKEHDKQIPDEDYDTKVTAASIIARYARYHYAKPIYTEMFQHEKKWSEEAKST